MAFSPNLFAVVARRRAPVPASAPRRKTAELPEQKLAELKGKKAVDRASKILDRLEGRIEAYDVEIKRLQKRKALAHTRWERVQDECLERMIGAGLDKADAFEVTFSPAALEVLDESLIPDEYIREKITTSADKIAIKAALARGLEIAGVRLTQKLSLIRK